MLPVPRLRLTSAHRYIRAPAHYMMHGGSYNSHTYTYRYALFLCIYPRWRLRSRQHLFCGLLRCREGTYLSFWHLVSAKLSFRSSSLLLLFGHIYQSHTYNRGNTCISVAPTMELHITAARKQKAAHRSTACFSAACGLVATNTKPIPFVAAHLI